MRAGRRSSGTWRQRFLHVPLVLLLAGTHDGIAPLAQAQEASAPSPSSAALRTPDFDESVRWYQDKLGFRLIASQSFVAGRIAVLERGGFLIEIAEVDPDATPRAPDTGARQVTRHPVISLLIPDVDQEIRDLAKEGVEILQWPEDELEGSYRAAQIRDNGRHRIELREPLGDRGGFHPRGR